MKGDKREEKERREREDDLSRHCSKIINIGSACLERASSSSGRVSLAQVPKRKKEGRGRREIMKERRDEKKTGEGGEERRDSFTCDHKV